MNIKDKDVRFVRNLQLQAIKKSAYGRIRSCDRVVSAKRQLMLRCIINCAPFKTQPNNSHVLRYKNEIRSRSVHQCVIHSPNLPRDTQVKVTLVDRPLFTTVAQKLYRCEHGVFTSRMCVHSRTLLSIEIVC
jgi:hypothetical protein